MASKHRKTFTYDGKKYQVYANTKEELHEKVFAKKLMLKMGMDNEETNLTIKEWGEKAVELYKTNQAEATKEKYLGVMRSSIFKELGHIKLKDATPIMLQKCLNLQEGRSNDHIARVSQQLKFIFRTAHENKMINENPATSLTKPKGTNNKRRSITDEERNAFLQATKDIKFVPFLFMYYCGCRPSEARKITSDDITMVEGKPLLHIRGTKTAKADRYVPIPSSLMDMIKKERQIEKYCALNKSQFNKLSNRLRDNMRDYLGGEYHWYKVEPTGKKAYWKKDYLVDPLAKDFTPYCLRHTFCTDLRDKGVDIRDAQYLMGHANISITANIYTHSDISTAVKIADVLEKKVTPK